jgi:NADPH:quinone reductase-like Zn-dependent oxidoreductase
MGASGGVGTFAVQIAKALGAEVTGVCTPAKMDLVWALDADHVVDYTRVLPAPLCWPRQGRFRQISMVTLLRTFHRLDRFERAQGDWPEAS